METKTKLNILLVLIFIVLVTMSVLILRSIKNIPCDNEYCLQQKILQQEAKDAKLEAQKEMREANRLHDIKLQEIRNQSLKDQAKIEANKPIEVRVQELKNSEMSLGEGIATVGAVGAGILGAIRLFSD